MDYKPLEYSRDWSAYPNPVRHIGFASGAFDLFHAGHRYFLKHARAQCDYLIVGVHSDASVKRLKGETRPAWELKLRTVIVKQWCDAAVPFDGDECALIQAIQPNVIFKGFNQVWQYELPCAMMLVRIGEIPGYSTTRMLGEGKSNASGGTQGQSCVRTESMA